MTTWLPEETLVSVDVETSGNNPSNASLLSIGACLVDDPTKQIYLELKPLKDRDWGDEAETVHKLDRSYLAESGLEPAEAMVQFEAWITANSAGTRPIFVGFNAPFDWMFVADYFWRYLGRNPFGISALDLKSYYMARNGVERWAETGRQYICEVLGLTPERTHNALDDALEQALLARVLMGRNEPVKEPTGR
jgi:DNA polymerase III epsilon subunit-like protein